MLPVNDRQQASLLASLVTLCCTARTCALLVMSCFADMTHNNAFTVAQDVKDSSNFVKMTRTAATSSKFFKTCGLVVATGRLHPPSTSAMMGDAAHMQGTCPAVHSTIDKADCDDPMGMTLWDCPVFLFNLSSDGTSS